MLVVQPLHQRGSLVGYPGGGHRALRDHAEGDRTLEVRRRPLLVDPLRQLHGPRPMRPADGRAGRVSGGPRAVRVARHQDRLAAASCAAADRVSRRRPSARRRRRHRPTPVPASRVLASLAPSLEETRARPKPSNTSREVATSPAGPNMIRSIASTVSARIASPSGGDAPGGDAAVGRSYAATSSTEASRTTIDPSSSSSSSSSSRAYP